jgi:integrase
MRGVMSRIYKVGMLHEKVDKNPLQVVPTRCKTNCRAVVLTPTQTFAILKSLTNLQHYTLVLTCAATALRASEILALRWHDILWNESRIRISKRWAGSDGAPKTDASDGYVPLHPLLAEHLPRLVRAYPLLHWRGSRLPIAKDDRPHSDVRLHLRSELFAPGRNRCRRAARKGTALRAT